MDETKRGRDLGAYLRQRVAQAFREGENTQVTGGEEVGQVEAMGSKGGGSAHAPAAARLHVREIPILRLAAECDAFRAVSFLVCPV